jgi:hypothetical protein
MHTITFEYKNTKVYIIFLELIFPKQKKMLIYRQFNMLYNLSRSKTTFGKNFLILENRFSRKPPYKGLWAILMPIFGISIVDNLRLTISN